MKKSYLLLHIAVILAGFTGVFGKLISLNEGLLVWYRVLFSAIILFFILTFFKKDVKQSIAEKFNIAYVGLLITTHWIFFYASIKYSNISIGVVCYCLTSLFTAIFEPLINKKRFSIAQLLLSGLTLLGISLIFHFDSSYQLGIVLGVISSAFAALYTVFNERLVQKHNSIVINYYQMLGGTIGLGLLLPVYLQFFPVATWIPSSTDFFYLLLLSAICTVTLYVLFTEVLKVIPAFTVNLSFNLEPIYAIILAFIFFNEGKEVNSSFYIGCSFVLLSVILQSFFSKPKNT
ncbi:DMT family transporter [Sphingobacterium faecium]|uniref:DMT family transporter n=1 Tax=Sphingobacterium faecium TaxID=34087 RepID=UPI000D33240E|nr:DMT family transporter [Sphingobacterium faecium]MQP26338.1 EamA family transporter [Sphingobacterium faecium]PTX13562.1 EamA domain-containing membrane protein RarD [Sphingobacterium faecium]UXD67954.1 DMT family transporter [Sphingobacterium faecium]GEM65141.1 permease [Sphingobacterium faecium NBRC 15299]